MSVTPTFVTTPKFGIVQFLNADSANTKKSLLTAGANGSKVTSVTVASTDTVDRIAQVWLTRSATNYLLVSRNIPAGSGSDGTLVSLDIMGLWEGLPYDSNGLPYLLLESGDVLKASLTTQVTAAKEVDIAAIGAHF